MLTRITVIFLLLMIWMFWEATHAKPLDEKPPTDQQTKYISENNKSYEKIQPTSCLAFGNSSGIHQIHLENYKSFKARCESRLAGPGWMIIQRRYNGHVDFHRNWTEYREGFGTLNGEYWLGLEAIHRLTKNRPHDILVYVMDGGNRVSFLLQTNFEISGEEEDYKILHWGPSLGNHWLGFTPGSNFATFDHFAQSNEFRLHFNDYETQMSNGWWYEWYRPHNIQGRFNTMEPIDAESMWARLTGSKNVISYLKLSMVMIRPIQENQTYFSNPIDLGISGINDELNKSMNLTI